MNFLKTLPQTQQGVLETYFGLRVYVHRLRRPKSYVEWYSGSNNKARIVVCLGAADLTDVYHPENVDVTVANKTLEIMHPGFRLDHEHKRLEPFRAAKSSCIVLNKLFSFDYHS